MALLFILFANMAMAYVGHVSSEAEITFDDTIELTRQKPSRAEIKRALEFQVQHLFGSLSMGDVRGAPKLEHEIVNDSIRVEETIEGRTLIHYKFRGTLVLSDNAGSTLSIALPNNPDTIWKTSVSNMKTKSNPCTDETYQDKEDFWYYWNPHRKGCEKVLKPGRDFHYVTARVNRVPKTTDTYPEYSRLMDTNGRILITLILGKDEPNRIRSPYKRTKKSADDENAKNYRKMAHYLNKILGFGDSYVWTNEEIKEIVKRDLNPLPYVEEFSIQYNQGPVRELVVQMIYTSSDIDYQSTGFHYFLEYALEKSSIMIYDGHSGLGNNLDLHKIRESMNREFNFNFNKSKYQIYFFNTCSSYTYYNDFFFMKKGSTKFLDLLSTGLETAFDGSVEVNMALIHAVQTWATTGKPTSYQELARQMENDNLFGVNGDEDNLN